MSVKCFFDAGIAKIEDWFTDCGGFLQITSLGPHSRHKQEVLFGFDNLVVFEVDQIFQSPGRVVISPGTFLEAILHVAF